MVDRLVRLLVCLVVPVTGCFGCPNHCFCYTWNGFVRTDCVRQNLFNTFVGFSNRTQVLDLSHNVITILHGNEFLDANLRHLLDIRLSGNELHQVDKLSFNGLELLQCLDLSHNSIEYLHPFTFNRNPNLKTLNVSFNPLSVIKDESFLPSARSLQVLDMANCRLQFVTSNSFADLNRLRFLNISRNIIRKINLDFLERMNGLRYLDVSKNDFPCNDHIEALFRLLVSRRIQFRTFCEKSQKIVMTPVVEAEETDHQPGAEERESDGSEETPPMIQEDSDTVFGDVTRFFQSIPSSYAAVCGVQVGALIGSFFTYFCMRKAVRNRKNIVHFAGAERGVNGGPNNENFALIQLTTPPGTPPSPYHSRFFPSNFTLSAT